MAFYLPYNLIKKFTQKEGNSYRHTLAHRTYLFLLFLHSGRIKIKEKGKIVKYLKTSHSALSTSLSYLEREGMITVKRGWITAKNLKEYKKSNYNLKFEFTEEDLKTSKTFYNKLFLCIYQTSAMLYGKKRKVEKILFPQTKSDSDSVMLKGGTVNTGFSCSQTTEFIQEQSSTYLAKLTSRHPNSTYKRIQNLKTENLSKNNSMMSYESGMKTPLTVDGFNTQKFSEIVIFKTYEDANKELMLRKKHNPEIYKSCFVFNDKFGTFSIVKVFPHKYFYSNETKPILKNLDIRFKKKED